jgi:hypothetical protein
MIELLKGIIHRGVNVWNNGVSIIQILVVKLSNTSTTFSQQVEITKCLRVWQQVFESPWYMYDESVSKWNRCKGRQLLCLKKNPITLKLNGCFRLFRWEFFTALLEQFTNTSTTFSQQVEIMKCLRVWQQVFERWTHRCLADI